MIKMMAILGIGAALWMISPSAAEAQVVVAPAPVVSYYYAPAPVAVAPAPVVSYYTPAVAPAVSYYTPAEVVAPAPVSYYYTPAPVAVAPAPVVAPVVAPVSYYYPATVRTGLFGRTTVKTPFYKIKY